MIGNIIRGLSECVSKAFKEEREYSQTDLRAGLYIIHSHNTEKDDQIEFLNAVDDILFGANFSNDTLSEAEIMDILTNIYRDIDDNDVPEIHAAKALEIINSNIDLNGRKVTGGETKDHLPELAAKLDNAIKENNAQENQPKEVVARATAEI